ncbi:MAG: hypothetical protein WCC27_00630 [Acidobacteriaceae bacterium]
MVELSVAEGKLVLHVRGIDQLWALRSTLEIPVQHITGVRADAEIARGWWHGLKLMGSDIPGVLHAGTFYQQGKIIFWDVHNPENTIVIDLRDERYGQLVVEVDDPAAAVALIQPYCQGA